MSAELRDILLESRFIERAPAYFGRFLRKAKAVAFEELGDMLDRGVDEGLLTEDEALEAINCGLVVRGLNRSDGSEEYLLVEVSWEITTSKVKGASRKAEILRKLGLKVRPVVAGRAISPEAEELAGRSGVEVMVRPAEGVEP
ncbi:MAG TPA: hypothetical protein ENF74_05135 [Firmicutes bacterium]|nr:hypothetical protein [Bacillota bacterium]